LVCFLIWFSERPCPPKTAIIHRILGLCSLAGRGSEKSPPAGPNSVLRAYRSMPAL
jgi:hypothetical protein